jgi:DNA-binding HxlR family transcriptional regulator
MDDVSPTSAGLSEALAAVGDRWSMVVVEALLAGPKRFGDLQGDVEGIASNVLSARLRKLTEHGLVAAEAYSDRPPRFSYELTDAGRELAEPLRMLAGWGSRHAEGVQRPAHASCGTALEVGWYCPSCREPVEPDADEELDYA